jgi:hypothetical protein
MASAAKVESTISHTASTTTFLFRIATERKNVELVKKLLCSQGFDFTIFFCEGAWHGSTEDSMIIEFANQSRTSVENIAFAIKALNQQDAVLLQEVPIFTVTI